MPNPRPLIDRQAEIRRISALVAEKVMGWHNNEANPTTERGMWGVMDYTDNGPVLAPDFPTYADDIAAAWEVVERMNQRGYDVTINGVGKKHCAIDAPSGVRRAYFGDCDTMPMAVCLAAILALSNDGGAL